MYLTFIKTIVYTILLPLLLNSVSAQEKSFQGKIAFEEIRLMSSKWERVSANNTAYYETSALGSGKIQVGIDSADFLSTVRLATKFDIQTLNLMNRNLAGKILRKSLTSDGYIWLNKQLSQVDMYPVKDYFFSTKKGGQTISIIFTSKSRHLEVMVKMGE